MSTCEYVSLNMQKTFGTLLTEFMLAGVRPQGSMEQGKAWGVKELADKLGISDRQMRNYRGDTSFPSEIESLENVLFGSSQSYQRTKRLALRELLDRARKGDQDTSTFGSVKFSEHRLPRTSSTVIGRRAEISSLTHTATQETINIVGIIGVGGIGKTTVVQGLVAALSSIGWSGFDSVFEWSFYNQRRLGVANADEFFRAAAAFFGMEEWDGQATAETGRRLGRRIGAQRCALLLDGLEPLQVPIGPSTGEIVDSALEGLLEELARFNAGCCIVTSRVELQTLTHFKAGTYIEEHLDVFAPSDAVQLLRTLGVRGDASDLKEAADSVGRHPLSVTLLGHWLRDLHDGETAQHKNLDYGEADVCAGGAAERLLNEYRKWLPTEVRWVLSAFSFFDRVVSTDELRIASGVMSRNSSVGLSTFGTSLESLVGLALVHEFNESSDGYSCHPLIAEFESTHIKQTTTSLWTLGHSLLADYWLASLKQPLREVADLTDGYITLSHLVEAERIGDAVNLLDQEMWQKDAYYTTNKLGLGRQDAQALLAIHTALGGNFETLAKRTQGRFLGNGAVVASSVHDYQRAINYADAQYEYGKKIGQIDQMAMGLGVKGEIELFLGNLVAAHKAGQNAVATTMGSASRWEIASHALAAKTSFESCDECMLHHYNAAIDLFDKMENGLRNRASGFNLIDIKIDQIIDRVRKGSNIDETRPQLEKIIQWADQCIVANSGNIPFYDALFLTGKARGIAWLSYLDQSSRSSATETIEMADQAFRKAGFERFRPLICAARIELLEIEARTTLLVSADNVADIEQQIQTAQRVSRHGPLIYMRLRVVDAAMHAFAAMRMKPSNQMTNNFISTLRDARRRKFKLRANSIEKNISLMS